jgi:hypothetical protein
MSPRPDRYNEIEEPTGYNLCYVRMATLDRYPLLEAYCNGKRVSYELSSVFSSSNFAQAWYLSFCQVCSQAVT